MNQQKKDFRHWNLFKQGEMMFAVDLKKRKRFPEVPDGRTQVQGDTLLCIKDTKFSFLSVIERGGELFSVGSFQQYLATCMCTIF